MAEYVRIAYRGVAGVLLADGWHNAQHGTFTIGEFFPDLSGLPAGDYPIMQGLWFGFDEPYRVEATATLPSRPDVRRVVGPVSSILALRS